MKRKFFAGGFGAVALMALGIQFVPVDRTNPEEHVPLDAPPEVMAVFQRACYDCHSNETQWPWYAHVAPMSWLVEKDVVEGREHLNFSTLGKLDWIEQDRMWQEIWEEVEEDRMPLWYYLPMHPEARLSDPDKELLRKWCSGEEIDQPEDVPKREG